MIWYDMIWYDMIWYDMICYDMIWYDRYDMIWYDMIWWDMMQQESLKEMLLTGSYRAFFFELGCRAWPISKTKYNETVTLAINLRGRLE